MYNIGEYVVHSTAGVCRIEDICRPDFEKDESRRYYILCPQGKTGSAKVFTPVDNKNVFIRKIMTESEVNALITEIPQIPTIQIKNERARKETYKKVMSEPYPANLVSIIKTVYERRKAIRAKTGHLPEFEQSYGQSSKTMLETEIGLVLGLPVERVEEYIIMKINSHQPLIQNTL